MPSEYRVPFNRPCLIGPELDYVKDAIGRGHISGDGHYTRRVNELLESLVSVPRAFLTTSCTHALEMTALLLDLGPGDEVILPSFTFVSTANAYLLRGARPVFADIRPDTLNLDEAGLERLITGRTRAIVVVHYAGVACEMDPILAIAARHGIPVIEDNAHGLLGQYRGRPLGSFGAMATLSFHETKNFTCGEGGALLVNDPELVRRAEIIREKGTDRSRFFRGEVDRYTWVDLGSSYLPSDMLAAYLYAQLEAADSIQASRRELWEFYAAQLAGWAAGVGARLPGTPAHCLQAYHMFYLIMPSLEARDEFIAFLKQRGIYAVFHYLPLHLSRMGRQLGGAPGDCPVTEDVSDRIVRLPFHTRMADDHRAAVVDAVRSFGA